MRKVIAHAIATFQFVASAAASEYTLSNVGAGHFINLRGQVVQSDTVGSRFLARGKHYARRRTRRDTIIVTYRAESPLQQSIHEKTVFAAR